VISGEFLSSSIYYHLLNVLVNVDKGSGGGDDGIKFKIFGHFCLFLRI